MKSAEKIACPKCGHEFELSDALSRSIREELRTELLADVEKQTAALQKQQKALRDQQELVQKERDSVEDLVASRLKEKQLEVEARAAKKVRDELGGQLGELQAALLEKDESIKTLRQQEREHRKLQQELEARAESLDAEVAKKVSEEKKRIQEETTRRLEAGHADKLKELSESLVQKDKALADLRRQEVDLRRQQQELKAAKEAQELELQRKLDEEREAIRQQAAKQASEAHRLKDAEKDRKIGDLMAALDEAQRKAAQGSMETQGEVLEVDFERSLKNTFAGDRISPVPKGVQGADIMQRAVDQDGRECGLLLWETKNTKAWSHQWIPKLKADMIACHADAAIIVSQALPEGVDRFGYVDGVWVSDRASAIPLAVALRHHLISLHMERRASVGKNQKMEALYRYFAGSEFRQKIMGVADAFTAMNNQLQRERAAMNRLWSEREKLIGVAVKNATSLYGDVQGIIGAAVETIPALELEAPALTPQLPRPEDPRAAQGASEAVRPAVAPEAEKAAERAAADFGIIRILAEELAIYRSCSFKDLAKLASGGPEEAERAGPDGGDDCLIVVKAEVVERGAIRLTVSVCEMGTRRVMVSASFVMREDGTVI